MNKIKAIGKFLFDPVDLTNKHKKQASWKHIAIINISGEVSEYYSWFLKKRFNLVLNKPLRGSHISFINDSYFDIEKALGTNEFGVKYAWEKLKEKYNNKKTEIELNLDFRSNGKHWWLNVSEESRNFLHSIRNEINLNRHSIF